MKDKLEFIENIADVENNLRYLIECRNSTNPEDKAFYESRMKMGASYVVMVIDGQVEFGPSRFLGYKEIERSDYEPKAHPDLRGDPTGQKLGNLFGAMQENSLLESFFYSYLNEHIEKGHVPQRKYPFGYFLNDAKLKELEPFINGIEAAGLQKPVEFDFKKVILRFGEILADQASVLKDFEIKHIHNNWVWIADSKGVLGNQRAHYEIRDMKKSLWVVLHFEGTQVENDLFHQSIKTLPKGLVWTGWRGSKSICVKPEVVKNNDDFIQQMVDQLLFLEESIGDEVRNLIIKGKNVLIDVKDEFAGWLQENTYDSYRRYIGDSKEETVNKLEEINSFFPEFELYVVDPAKVNTHIEMIRDLLQKKERKKNVEFVEYDIKNSNGIPKAIIGKNNYGKFLNEKFSNSTTPQTETQKDATMNTSTAPINQILYGPPGTGKTYNTINHAISIIEKKSIEDLANEKRGDVTTRFKELLVNDWEKPNGQIGFVTFHQSMSYEDFIEGIKPSLTSKAKVTYDIVPGIFKSINQLATNNYLRSIGDNSKYVDFDQAFDKLKDEWEVNPELEFPLKTAGSEFTILGVTNRSIHFKKASGGTGHTLSISTLRDLYYGKREVSSVGVGIYYPGIIKKLRSYELDSSVVEEIKPYVLIIDEINRGNVSQIFGELITLLEPDKRLGENEELELSLPYSKEPLTVAPNLFIIGTMNTADRSVEALDTALRRRFSFEEMMPIPELVATDLGEKNTWNKIQISEVLKTINDRITVLVDRDHQIGHSYFLGLKNSTDFDKDLKAVFTDKIIPLLQEYFFNDYVKIGMVLGKGFVTPYSNSEVKFAHIEDSVDTDYQEGNRFEIRSSKDIELKKALDLLMRNGE